MPIYDITYIPAKDLGYGEIYPLHILLKLPNQVDATNF